jgi:predicted ATPase
LSTAARFIGRRVELDRIRELFARGHVLVTLWGTGGAGKTRLAMEHVAASRGRQTVCELAEARSRSGMIARMASALGVRAERGDRVGSQPKRVGSTDDAAAAEDEALSELANRLRERPGELVVLDNFEQLVGDAAQAIAALMRAAPEVRFLVTSRERLSLSEEVAIEISPLPTADAVELFMDRIKTARPDLVLDEANAREVRDLVEKLDGLPLAIELAAARFDLLGVDGILRRMNDRLELLSRAPRNVPARHATLKHAIQWSWDLLDPHEQSALAQCAIFGGGFAAEAAETILELPSGAPPVLDLLDALRAKSMLRTYAPHDGFGEMRFGMLDSIRDLAIEKLGAHEELRSRHARYYIELGKQLAQSVDGSRAAVAMRTLSLERDNLSQIIESSTAKKVSLEALLAIDPLYASQGPFVPYLELLDRAIEGARLEEVGSELLAGALRARGRAHQMLGHVAQARSDLLRALETAEQSVQRVLAGRLLADLGVLHHRMREMPEALAHYQRALAIDRASGHRGEEGRVLGNIGALLHDGKQYREARSHYADALDCLREVGDRRLEGRFLANLGVLEQELGAIEEARGSYERALITLRQVGDRRLEAITLGNLGVLEQRAGAHEQARVHYEKALSALKDVGDARSEALALARLGGVEATLGDLESARRRLAEAEQIASRLEDRIAEGIVRLHRGFLEIALAMEAWGKSREEEAVEHARAVRARIARARTPSSVPGSETLADRSDDARSTITILERALSALAAGSGDAPPADALILGPAARSFRPPQGEWLDIRRRQTLRRILLRLVEERRVAPGIGVSVQALIEAAWPGERIKAEAASNRLYVALATLRKLGLKEQILSQDDGYLLEPTLEVIWSSGA